MFWQDWKCLVTSFYKQENWPVNDWEYFYLCIIKHSEILKDVSRYSRCQSTPVRRHNYMNYNSGQSLSDSKKTPSMLSNRGWNNLYFPLERRNNLQSVLRLVSPWPEIRELDHCGDLGKLRNITESRKQQKSNHIQYSKKLF